MRTDNDILIPEMARLLSEGKEVRFTPSGVSMRPFIEGDCDSVIVAPFANQQAPKIGQIVLAKTEKSNNSVYVLHRIIGVTKDGLYRLQGDGNLTGEEYCCRSNIYGCVRRIESPSGCSKLLTHGYLWRLLKPARQPLLKLYRHIIIRKKNDKNFLLI